MWLQITCWFSRSIILIINLFFVFCFLFLHGLFGSNYFFFYCNTKNTTCKTRHTLFTILLTIHYLYYTTSLDCDFNTTFIQFVLRLHTYVPNKLQFETGFHLASSIFTLLYLAAMWRSVSYFLKILSLSKATGKWTPSWSGCKNIKRPGQSELQRPVLQNVCWRRYKLP